MVFLVAVARKRIPQAMVRAKEVLVALVGAPTVARAAPLAPPHLGALRHLIPLVPKVVLDPAEALQKVDRKVGSFLPLEVEDPRAEALTARAVLEASVVAEARVVPSQEAHLSEVAPARVPLALVVA